MLPVLRGPAVFVAHIIRVRLSDRWLICPGFYLYGPGPFCMGIFFISADCLFVFLVVFCIVILCFIYLLFLRTGFLAGGGEGVPFSSLVVFSAWSP